MPREPERKRDTARPASNRLFLKISGRRLRAYVKHVGRRSGREYVNPASAYPLSDGFVLPILNGLDSQCVRNVLNTGRLTLVAAATSTRSSALSSFPRPTRCPPSPAGSSARSSPAALRTSCRHTSTQLPPPPPIAESRPTRQLQLRAPRSHEAAIPVPTEVGFASVPTAARTSSLRARRSTPPRRSPDWSSTANGSTAPSEQQVFGWDRSRPWSATGEHAELRSAAARRLLSAQLRFAEGSQPGTARCRRQAGPSSEMIARRVSRAMVDAPCAPLAIVNSRRRLVAKRDRRCVFDPHFAVRLSVCRRCRSWR